VAAWGQGGAAIYRFVKTGYFDASTPWKLGYSIDILMDDAFLI
jgi:hypothetical protein